MSQSLEFDNGNQRHLASNRGWSEFLVWIDSLPLQKYPALIQFAEYGVTEKLKATQVELEIALRDNTPFDPYVKGTANLMLESFKAESDTSSVVLVTNGVEKDDGKTLRVARRATT